MFYIDTRRRSDILSATIANRLILIVNKINQSIDRTKRVYLRHRDDQQTIVVNLGRRKTEYLKSLLNIKTLESYVQAMVASESSKGLCSVIDLCVTRSHQPRPSTHTR